MATNVRRGDAPLNLLEMHFGKSAGRAQQILNTVRDAPTRVWRADELLAAAGIDSIVEGYMLIARLTVIGAIAHPGIGTYTAVEEAQQARSA